MPVPVIEGMSGEPVDLAAPKPKPPLVDRAFGKICALLVRGLNPRKAREA